VSSGNGNKNRLHAREKTANHPTVHWRFTKASPEQRKPRNNVFCSKDEDRFLLLGFSAKLRLLVVVHAYRQDDKEIRIISARKAMPKERKQYGGFL
jgi:uncharacterized DUF497 family protein